MIEGVRIFAPWVLTLLGKTITIQFDNQIKLIDLTTLRPQARRTFGGLFLVEAQTPSMDGLSRSS